MEQLITGAVQHAPWNKGKTGGAEGTPEAEGHLGHVSSAPDRKANPRARSFQPRDRQQIKVVRFDEVARP
jgi:hypothetical protein